MQPPEFRCEIYAPHGLSYPPLAAVLHPEFSRRRGRRPNLAAAKTHHGGAQPGSGSILLDCRYPAKTSELMIFPGINCVVLPFRFLDGDAGLKHSEHERSNRVQAHRKMARKDA